jgi:hypothetical protein
VKHLKIEDLKRLSLEIGASTETCNDWAERVGIDPDVLEQMGVVATNSAHEKTIEMAREAFEEQGFDLEDPPEDAEGYALRMNIGEIIKSACLSMFALGFETHKQFGNSDRDMSQ